MGGGLRIQQLKTAKLRTVMVTALAVFGIATVLNTISVKSAAAATPGGVTGPTLWLRADRGATASSWADQSPSGNNATQGTAANRPTPAGNINFNPVLQVAEGHQEIRLRISC